MEASKLTSAVGPNTGKNIARFQEILEVVGPRIVSGTLDIGDAVTLAEFEEEFDCSRTVARDVQRALELMGLVRPKRRRGMIVQPKDNWNFFDVNVVKWRLASHDRDSQLESLIDLRQAIEPKAAELAAKNASKEQRDEILEAGLRVYKLGQVGVGPDFITADLEFHRLIMAGSGNEMFAQLSPAIEYVLTWRAQRGLTPSRPGRQTLEDHHTAAWAVYRGESKTAEVAIRDVLAEIKEAFEANRPNVIGASGQG